MTARLTATEGGLPWFYLQVTRAAGLTARNNIPIHDYGVIGCGLFIAMPVIAGMGLDALRRSWFPRRQRPGETSRSRSIRRACSCASRRARAK